jgi:2-oxoacid dehydrogenases acyltransferase (catalytic domain)
MPLFKRPDGDLVRDETPVQTMLPYLAAGRWGSVVLHETTIDLTRTEPWLAAYNRAAADHAVTLFHLFLWACAHGLHAYPKLNRFVSARRLYARRTVAISFTAKRAMTLEAPVVTVKVDFPNPRERLASVSRRIAQALGAGRRGGQPVDRELGVALRLPDLALWAALAGYRLLDRWNLLPASVIANDPNYASLFVANLGSVGLDRTYHHLFEFGTCSVFAVMGTRALRPLVSETGTLEVRPTLEVRWSFDDRIANGLYCARGIAAMQAVMEDPAAALGRAEAAADLRVTPPASTS